ncbi:MAG: FIST C-terminal domain-containing protein [Polyangiaceae bacterium]
MRTSLCAYQPGTGFSEPLPQRRPSFVLVFGATSLEDDSAFWADLTRTYPDTPIAGCSTAGEVLGTRVTDGGAALGIVDLERSTARMVTASVRTTADSHAAGAQLAKELGAADLRGVLVFSDGRVVNGSALVRGLVENLPDGVVVTGGLAGDGKRFDHTWVVQDGRPVRGVVSAIGLYGASLTMLHGSQGGWGAFGPERTVTASEGSVLYRLDDQPALEIYKRYLGDMAKDLPASALRFPLSVRADRNAAHSVVRTVLSIDERRQSMTFAGDVPQGSLVRFMQASFDRLVDGAAQAASDAMSTYAAGDTLCLVVSCVGRRLVLGERIEEELDSVHSHLPAGVCTLGFYSYGEISPVASGDCGLHNQTMTLTILVENAAPAV